MVIVYRKGDYQIKTLDNVHKIREVEQLELSLHEIQKGAHKHFMLKEIMEQPEVCCSVRFGQAACSPIGLDGRSPPR